jgi:allantoate deiminase
MPPTASDSSTTRAAEVISRCQTLARFSEEETGLSRPFLSAPMRDCHNAITEWLRPLGITPVVDAAGNLRATYPAAENPTVAPSLLIGSHLDTVPNAGSYDGPLGVVLAVSLFEELHAQNLRFPYAIELVAFSEEEGVRFGVPFIGSRALVGTLDDATLDRVDSSGVSIREAIQKFGLDPAQISSAQIAPENTLGYLEFHIEQGPVLEKLNLPIAAVEAIVGQSRLSVTFGGVANHAGTTPMDARRDALAAAAEWMVIVENEATRTPGLVATVGFIKVQPGAANVIPREAHLTLDIRHESDAVRTDSLRTLASRAQEIATRRNLSLVLTTLLAQPAVAMDPFLIAQIESAIRSASSLPHRMPSGAGHDAMILAERVPAAMIFLRSPGGVSHHPAETVLPEDVARAIDCGLSLLKQLAASPEFLQSPQTRSASAKEKEQSAQ